MKAGKTEAVLWASDESSYLSWGRSPNGYLDAATDHSRHHVAFGYDHRTVQRSGYADVIVIRRTRLDFIRGIQPPKDMEAITQRL